MLKLQTQTVIPICIGLLLFVSMPLLYAGEIPDIKTVIQKPVLDDYDSNVLLGYNIVQKTGDYASRYVGNQLNCSSCHINAGTEADLLPLFVAGIYPRWEAKNNRVNELTAKIRTCFVLALDGIMPPASSPEIKAIKTYIHFLSAGQRIGQIPEGRGVTALPMNLQDPSPVRGLLVYQNSCQNCHAIDGSGSETVPPLWGSQSYTSGSMMNEIRVSAGFIKNKVMKIAGEISLSDQQALDVAAYLNKRERPVDPEKEKLVKIIQDLGRLIGIK